MQSGQSKHRRTALLIIDETIFQPNSGKIQPFRDLQVAYAALVAEVAFEPKSEAKEVACKMLKIVWFMLTRHETYRGTWEKSYEKKPKNLGAE